MNKISRLLSYASVQRKFLELCQWINAAPLPVSEWTLMLFCAHLSKTIKAASIKVYLSGVRSLHIENGFTNPLSNCLRLERVLWGIKRCQGLSKREWLPVTLTVLSRIRRVLNFDGYDDILFWAACCTGFFGSALGRVHYAEQYLRCACSFVGGRRTNRQACEPKSNFSLHQML